MGRKSEEQEGDRHMQLRDQHNQTLLEKTAGERNRKQNDTQ